MIIFAVLYSALKSKKIISHKITTIFRVFIMQYLEKFWLKECFEIFTTVFGCSVLKMAFSGNAKIESSFHGHQFLHDGEKFFEGL